MSSVGQQMLLMNGGTAATLDFLGATSYPSEGQTVTFPGVAIGSPAGSRRVFVVIPYYIGGTSYIPIASVTIGGSPATIHAQMSNYSGDPARGGTALASAPVQTGTAADIVVTWSASGAGFYRPEIAVYRVTGLQSTTPVDLETVTSNGTSTIAFASANVVKNGVVLGCCNTSSGSNNSRTMSGLPTDYMVNPVTGRVYIGGGEETATPGTASVTVDNLGSYVWTVLMASFR